LRATIYYFAPDVKEQHWYWITPGSVIGVALWAIASIGLRVYLHFFNSYTRLGRCRSLGKRCSKRKNLVRV
jgi:uncharacterized BrkB/YihY/UPF0761 family membrane protein